MIVNSYTLRKLLVDIARRDVGKTESAGKNAGDWIKKLWDATSWGQEGYREHAAYCAAGMCYVQREWLNNILVRQALGLNSVEEAEKWRCKASSVKRDPNNNWLKWAKAHGLQILGKNCILHLGDIVIYDYSHIEIVTNDDNTEDGPFVAIGYNTNAAGSRDGEGCYEKPRSRASVEAFIRILP